jgi:glycosidase
VQSGRTRTQQEIFSYVQALLGVRREHAALCAGRLWHLVSDESSYVFLRESEEEQIAVAFNNSDKARELRIPLNGTPAEKMAGISLLFGDAKAQLSGHEIQLTLPPQSLSIFSLN